MEILLRLGFILAPIVFILGTYSIARKWHIGRHASLSVHGGQNKKTAQIFGAMTLLLAVWYYSGWVFLLNAQLTIPYFWPLFITATLCIILISLVPARPSSPKLHLMHRAASTILCFIMLCLVVLIVLNNPSIATLAQLFMWSFTAFVPLAAMGYLLVPTVRKNFFIVEAIAIILFGGGVAVLALTL